MKKVFVPAAALLMVTAGVAIAAELQSGLQVGEAAGVFNVFDVTGPSKGKSLCYR